MGGLGTSVEDDTAPGGDLSSGHCDITGEDTNSHYSDDSGDVLQEVQFTGFPDYNSPDGNIFKCDIQPWFSQVFGVLSYV